MFCSVFQCITVCSNVLQCVAVCCSVLQCVAVCCSALQSKQCISQSKKLRHHRLFYYYNNMKKKTNALQHTVTHCSTLQRTATHCNTLQHTATPCNTLHFLWPATWPPKKKYFLSKKKTYFLSKRAALRSKNISLYLNHFWRSYIDICIIVWHSYMSHDAKSAASRSLRDTSMRVCMWVCVRVFCVCVCVCVSVFAREAALFDKK